MAERNEQLLEWVRQELDRQPDLGSGKLFEMARERDDSLADSTLPQFHARYVLPIKRERAAERGGGTAKEGGGKARRRTARKPKRGAQAAAVEAEAPKPRRSRTTGKRGAAGDGSRESIRAVFLEFAREFAEADSRTQIVQVLSRVDEYVDRVMESQR
jgi:hypothetical protein